MKKKIQTVPAALAAMVFAAILAANAWALAPEAKIENPKSGAPAAGVDGGWWANTQKNLAAQEYSITRQEGVARASSPGLKDLSPGASWQAPNRAHDLRTYFTENGPRVVRRTSEKPEWTWGIELLNAPTLVETRTNGNRIEFHREGGLVEWYVNDAKGLEQGFTIEDWDSSEIALDLAVRGDLQAGMMPGGKTVEFLSEGGVGLIHYGELKAWDAAGRELPSRMELADAAIRLVVDAAGAQYPVTVDPVATSVAWTAESDQAYAYFGSSVASAGDVNGDGYADVIVGAPYYDNGQTDEGRAFVYLGSAAGLSTSAAWTAEGDQAAARFGFSTASAGDVNGDGYADVIVGAFNFSNGQASEGRAFVYLGSASGLQTTATWTAEGDQAGVWFGASVAGVGDVNGDGYADVIVGALNYSNGQPQEGRAFVYLGSATGLSATAAWTAESDLASARFGCSVASAGDVNGDGYADVIVGAYHYSNGQTYEGRAFVYLGSPSGLSTTAAWIAESDQASAGFGFSVASAGDVNGDGYADVIVGAPWYTNGQSYEGMAFVYLGSASGLSTAAIWTAESDQADAAFSLSVAGAGDVNGDGYADVIVGVPSYESGQFAEGRAFVYLGSASGLLTTATWTAESDQESAYFGASVASAGDINGDGYSDVIVGASDYANGETDEGRAFVYLGSASGLSAASGWAAESNQANAQFGISVAGAGDVNGDGYADVIVGAYGYDNGQIDEGMAFVYIGSAAGLSTTAAWTAEGNQASALFGGSVAGAGDVNGDGYSDVIVGADYYDNGHTDEGMAFVYLGSAAGLSATPAWTAEGNQAGAYFGISVAGAGDVNGDGYADVIVGASYYDNNGQTDAGRAFLYLGSASGLLTTATWTAEGDQGDGQLGLSVAGAGDVNGDGYSDVIVGMPFYDGGRVLVFLGSAAGLPTTATWTAASDQTFSYLGRSVAGAGDVNGDGYSDVIVGASSYSNGQSQEGRAYVFPGSASGLLATATWTAESNQANARFGRSVAGAGDVNGDGYADVIVGAHVYDNGQADEGRAFLYYGNGEAGRGMSLKPEQLFDPDGPAGPMPLRSLQQLGRTDREAGVYLQLTGRTPYGRGKVKLQAEVKPLGVPFDGTGLTVSPAWTDLVTTETQILLDAPVALPVTSAVYRWRIRLLYHPATTPSQTASRWITASWNGLQEGDFRLSPPHAPSGPGATAIATNSITWTWTDNSAAESGYKVWADSGASAPTALRTTTAAGVASWQHNSLSPNAQYSFQAAATNGAGDSAKTTTYSAWTLAAVPVAPVVNNPTISTLDVAIGSGDGNSTPTVYAIYCPTALQWVQTGGALGASAAWQTAAAWGTRTVTGLAGGTQYSFATCARNGSGVETANGPSAVGYTQCTLTYSAGAYGSITGATPQTVNYGEDGTAVTAVATAGYTFINWSDASTENPRTDTGVTGDITVTALFADITPPTSSLAPLTDATLASNTVHLPFTADDTGSGADSTELWVKAPGADEFVYSGLTEPPIIGPARHIFPAGRGLSESGISGAFNYTFAAGDGFYEFATKAMDSDSNTEADPTTAEVSVLVNTLENSDFTTTLTSADQVCTFPMTNALDIVISITGATPGGTITVSRTVGDVAPAGYDPALLIDEYLTIMGAGLGTAWTATLTWNFDPANDTLGAPLDTLYQFDGPGNYTRRWTITPSGSTILVPGLTSFSDWYAGALMAPAGISDWTTPR